MVPLFFILSVRPSAAVVSHGEILRPNTDLSIKDVVVICAFFSPFQRMQLCACNFSTYKAVTGKSQLNSGHVVD